MADTLKFGPQWLRALSDGGNVSANVTSPPTSPGVIIPQQNKYKLAEFRYGKEEMLAFFLPNSKIPEDLKQIPSICLEKTEHPLAFVPLSEDEQRLMSACVNSSAVLRMMGRGSSTTGPPVRGGRGASERGRGRGRGRGEGYFQRGQSYDEEGFGRGRHTRTESWEEGREKRFERGFAPGFAPGRGTFEEDPDSPRRTFSRSMSSDNWREAKKDGSKPAEQQQDDDGDWRRAGPREKWGTRGTWRDYREGGFDRGGYHDRTSFDHYHRPPYERGERYGRTKSGSWDDGDDPDLPEWSTTEMDDLENLGTFDASGAFMSLRELEEAELKERGKGDGIENGKEEDVDSNVEEQKNNGAELKEKPKKAKEMKENEKAKTKDNHVHENSPVIQKQEDRSIEDKKPKEVRMAKSKSPKPQEQKRQDSETKANVNNKTKSKDIKTKQEPEKVEKEKQLLTESTAAVKELLNIGNSSPKNQPPGHLTAAGSRAATGEITKSDSVDESAFDHLERAAEDLVATWTAEEDAKLESKSKVEMGSVPIDHGDAKKWFYRDPQGDLQGPFTSAEMAEWFSAGYFTMNLHVKRGCDDSFQPLGDLIKRIGRVPFLPGPTIPPMKSAHPAMSIPTTTPVTVGGAQTPPDQPVDPQQAERLRLQQQQVLMQQQQQQHFMHQTMMRQMQLQSLVQQLQHQEGFQKLSPEQQQHFALQFLVKQQSALLQQQQQRQPEMGLPPQLQPPQTNPSTQAPGQPQVSKLSPRSPTIEQPPAHPAFNRSMSQPGEGSSHLMHRTMSQPAIDENATTLWGALHQQPPMTQLPPVSAGGWNQPNTSPSIWDEQQVPPAKPLEEIQRLEQVEMERKQREAEEKREQEERMKIEEELRRQAEMDQKKEMERQRSDERQRNDERQRIDKLKREREELRLRREGEDRRRQEEEARRQEEIRRRQQDEDERKRREVEELERKRAEELNRRAAAEELRRQQQQQEMLRRMQQEQMANIQLPASAQWGRDGTGGANSLGQNSAPSLTEILHLEQQKAQQEHESKQRDLEAQRAQLASLQQQQQQQSKSWASQRQQAQPQQQSGLSLLDIQQEQQRQHELDRQKREKNKQSIPLATAAVWGGTPHVSNWATEGAWGKSSGNVGFWDEAESNKKNNNSKMNAAFPALGNMPAMQNQPASKQRVSKSKKEEETVQKLFQAQAKPKDEFTQWCENVLKDMQSSIDVPVFVAFLQEVESPYEIHDYVKSYLGETKEATDFATKFLEKRSHYKKQAKQQQQQEERLWGPASAVNPSENRTWSSEDKSKSKKNKKKMQKLDPGILGFTVHAAPDRIVGEIDSGTTPS